MRHDLSLAKLNPTIRALLSLVIAALSIPSLFAQNHLYLEAQELVAYETQEYNDYWWPQASLEARLALAYPLHSGLVLKGFGRLQGVSNSYIAANGEYKPGFTASGLGLGLRILPQALQEENLSESDFLFFAELEASGVFALSSQTALEFFYPALMLQLGLSLPQDFFPWSRFFQASSLGIFTELQFRQDPGLAFSLGLAWTTAFLEI